MANEEHLARLLASGNEKNDCQSWNQWRKKHPFTRIDLSHADLHRRTLEEAVRDTVHGRGRGNADVRLDKANLRGANLSGANLKAALLQRADLSGADLTGAILIGADLGGANLGNADLTGAILIGADLWGANLGSADLRGAKFGSASGRNTTEELHFGRTNVAKARITRSTFAGVNTTGLIGLESVRYSPDPPAEPQAAPQAAPVQPAAARPAAPAPSAPIPTPAEASSTTLFISYARADAPFVDRLDASLRELGFNTWVDRGQLQGGQSWLKEIATAIESCSMMLVVLSPDAVQSDYVESEYLHAHSQKKPVIPLDYRASNTPLLLARLQIIDFRTVTYDAAVQSLLRALKAKIG